jgi:hypothetical protein
MPSNPNTAHECCETCRFWLSLPHGQGGGSVCRRFPPIFVPARTLETTTLETKAYHNSNWLQYIPTQQHVPDMSCWPSTSSDDWCGEWSIRNAEQS